MSYHFQTEIFLLLFCEKNSDGTIKLRLKGKELDQRYRDRIIGNDVIYICKFLKNYPEVNEINLSYNEIEDEGLDTFCYKIFSKPNNIVHLNLMHCDITDAGIKQLYLTSKLGFLKLKTLRLSGNKLGPTGGHMTALVLQNCSDLEYLDIGDTNQTADSIDCLLLEVYRSKIKVLNISRVIAKSLLGQVNNTFISESLSELIRVHNKLVEIHAQKCNIDAHDVEILIQGLKLNKTLKFLDIGYNNVCCVGVEFLAEWLKTRPPLQALNIAGNKIKNHGAVALSFGMPFSKLRLLDVSYNRITDEGIISVLNSIKKPYMLRYFYIWGNQFGPKANKILDRMLLSSVFEQECIDVKIYIVDDVPYAAHYPADRYKQKYYDLMDHGCAVELKIKRNYIEAENDKPKALVNFKHTDRYPPLYGGSKATEPSTKHNINVQN